MRDWKAYAEHLRALAEKDPNGVFVGADVVLELIDERTKMIAAMLDLARGAEICDYYAIDADPRCLETDLACTECSFDCKCKTCAMYSDFEWGGLKKPDPAPEITVTDEPPEDLADAERRYIIVIDSDGTVTARNMAAVIEPSLSFLQGMVGGRIETLEFRVPGTSVRYVAVFDEEGKLKDRPMNELATKEFAPEFDWIAGTVLLLKIEGTVIITLAEADARRLMDVLGKEWEVQV